jgi:RhoGAP domain
LPTKGPSLSDFPLSKLTGVPIIIEQCVLFIESEGVESEGIYRVPGNRAHVELLFQKFEEGELVWSLLEIFLKLIFP